MVEKSLPVNEKFMMEGRKIISMTGVDGVDGFTDQNLKLTVSGIRMIISGKNIKITSYNKDNGLLNANGNFTEIRYTDKKQPFFKRLFK